MHRLSVAGASRSRPSSGHLAPSLLDDYPITRELGLDGCGADYPALSGGKYGRKCLQSRAPGGNKSPLATPSGLSQG
jgi:hypothetical protein